MKQLEYEIIIEQEEDQSAGYSVSCPALSGCFSNGGTVEDAKKNMREAIAFHIEGLKQEGYPVPEPHTYSAYVELPA